METKYYAVIGINNNGYNQFYQARQEGDYFIYYNSQILNEDKIHIDDEKITYKRYLNGDYKPTDYEGREIKRIEVSKCENCPFFAEEYDDFAVGYDTYTYCTLAKFLNLKESFIAVYNMGDDDYTINTPKWCPLNNFNISIKKKIN
jgi:hypothetical protein